MKENAMNDTRTCFVIGVQGDARQWNRAAYAVDAMKRHVKDADVAVVYLDDIPDASPGAEYLKANLRPELLIRVGGGLELIVRERYARHSQQEFAPIVLVRMFLVQMPSLAGYDRIIGFDADMDILDDMTPLVKMAIPTGIGGVVDRGWPSWEHRAKCRPVPADLFGEGNPCRKSLKTPLYNGGLVVFDRTTLPKDYMERVRWVMKKDERVVFPWLEQDMLNLAFDFTPLPDRYNVITMHEKPDDKPVVRHYVGKRAKETYDVIVRRWIRGLRKEAGGGQLKVVVYAIGHNEAKFVDRWMESMSEADEVCVLDTGSTDGTVDMLRAWGAKVKVARYAKWNSLAEYKRLLAASKSGGPKPWRFDWARNDSIDWALQVAPDADILVCTDEDEVLLPGWRDRLEKAWLDYTEKNGEPPTTAQYEYVWNFNPDGSDGTKFLYEKVHSPKSARWSHPVHEILAYEGGKRMVRVEGMRLEHHADPTKSRGQYLHLLELSVDEDPADDRNMHYLGREYMFYRRWDDCIATLKRHLALPRAQWRAERAASMRFMAKCYGAKKDVAQMELWLRRAMLEEPTQREAALELAELMHTQKDWPALVRACEACLAVKERRLTYLTKAEAWGARPHDLYSIGLWYTGRRKEAIKANEEAMRLDPNDKRLKENDRIMREIIAQKG